MPKLTTIFLESSVIEKLSKAKIFSALDFVQTDVDKLANVSQLPIKDILQVKHDLVKTYSSRKECGLERFEKVSCCLYISTGIKSLDDLLKGGLEVGAITELCGLSASGKSQLCMAIAVNVAFNTSREILYIDTKNDASGKRMYSFCQRICKNEEECKTVLSKISVTRVKDIYELMSELYTTQKQGKRIQLIIIDSLTVVTFPFLGLSGNEGIGHLNHIASVLKRILYEQHIPAVVTNLGAIYDQDDESEAESKQIDCDIKPLLGKYWKHVPSTRLAMEKSPSAKEKRTVKVMKSCHLNLGKECIINLTPDGIF